MSETITAQRADAIIQFLRVGNYSYKEIINFTIQENIIDVERHELLRFAVAQSIWLINNKLTKVDTFKAGSLFVRLVELSADLNNVWKLEETLNKVTTISDYVVKMEDLDFSHIMTQIDNLLIEYQLDNNKTSFLRGNRFIRYLTASVE